MKFILSLVLALFLAASPALAASPTASLRTDSLRHYVYLTFSNLKGVSRVNYTLVYDTNRGQKGIEGGFKTGTRTTTSTRRQILGTCSSGRCVFQTGIKNLQLDVTFSSRSGGTTNVSKSLL